MRLQHFNAGKNNRDAPHLIGQAESTSLTNVDIEGGPLLPVNAKASAGIVLDKFAYFFEKFGTWIHSSTNRDYVEYQEKVYFTQDGTVPQFHDGDATYNLGIALPNEIIAAAEPEDDPPGTRVKSQGFLVEK